MNLPPQPMDNLETVSIAKWARDTAERAVATYFEAFFAFLIVSWTPAVDVTIWQTAAWSAIPAGLAVLKAAFATLRGTADSASLVKSNAG